MYNDVKIYFENEQIKKSAVTENKVHGRTERREYYLETNISWLHSRGNGLI
jgi:hypothetical protein